MDAATGNERGASVAPVDRKRRLLEMLGLAVLAAAAFAAATAGGRAAKAPSGLGSARELQTLQRLIARGLPVFCAGGGGRDVALSFDDGPDQYSWQLLSELHDRAQATFFLIGEAVSGYPRVVRADTTQEVVGDHTQTHAVLTRLPRSAIRSEIADGKRAVEAAAGVPVWLFRSPGDHWNAAIEAVAREQHLLSVAYTVDPRDWALHTAAQVTKAVLSDPRLVPGSIVLLHESRPSTVEAVPAIIAGLQRRGFRLVTVPRLLVDDPPTLAEEELDARAGSCVHLYARPD